MKRKRLFDFAVSLIALVAVAPVLAAVTLAIWLQDFHSPFYRAKRAARGGAEFTMIKFRSMVVNADRLGGSSTAATDRRITPVGNFVRSYKLDELAQLCNVVAGQMSLVGPRPQVVAETLRYTPEERRMLSIRPGITDLASIVFADEGKILAGSADPDSLYDQIIRPWKSRLALLYIDRRSFRTDLKIIWLTFLAIFARERALRGVQCILSDWDADPLLRQMASRQHTLLAYPPPGMDCGSLLCGNAQPS